MILNSMNILTLCSSTNFKWVVPLNGLPSIYHSTDGVGSPTAVQFTVPDSPTLTLVSNGGLTHLGLAGTKRRDHYHVAIYTQKTLLILGPLLQSPLNNNFRGFHCCVDLGNWMFIKVQFLIHILQIISYSTQIHISLKLWFSQNPRKLITTNINEINVCFKILT